MKLVEILARELGEWPEGYVFIAQEDYGSTWAYVYEPEFDGEKWIGYTCKLICDFDLATDYTTAIITKEIWEAEKERINAKGQVRLLPG